MAWPRVPLEKSRTTGRQTDGSTGCNENAQHAPSEMKSLLESADGSMATVALGRENNDVPPTARFALTPTGLLMEGHYTF